MDMNKAFFLNYTKAAYKQHFHSMRRRHQTQQRHSSNLSPELFQWQAPGRLNKKQVHDRAPCGNSTSCLGMGGWRTCSGELACFLNLRKLHVLGPLDPLYPLAAPCPSFPLPGSVNASVIKGFDAGTSVIDVDRIKRHTMAHIQVS